MGILVMNCNPVHTLQPVADRDVDPWVFSRKEKLGGRAAIWPIRRPDGRNLA